jgi:hypothetical protein
MLLGLNRSEIPGYREPKQKTYGNTDYKACYKACYNACYKPSIVSQEAHHIPEYCGHLKRQQKEKRLKDKKVLMINVSASLRG